MAPREIYRMIKQCPFISSIDKKLFSSDAWLHRDDWCTGFLATVKDNGVKWDMLTKVVEWCDDNELPVEIYDRPTQGRSFHIKIINAKKA